MQKFLSAEALWLDDSKKGGNKDDFFAEDFQRPKWAQLPKAPVGELQLYLRLEVIWFLFPLRWYEVPCQILTGLGIPSIQQKGLRVGLTTGKMQKYI